MDRFTNTSKAPIKNCLLHLNSVERIISRGQAPKRSSLAKIVEQCRNILPRFSVQIFPILQDCGTEENYKIDKEYLAIAKKKLQFLLEKIYSDKNFWASNYLESLLIKNDSILTNSPSFNWADKDGGYKLIPHFGKENNANLNVPL